MKTKCLEVSTRVKVYQNYSVMTKKCALCFSNQTVCLYQDTCSLLFRFVWYSKYKVTQIYRSLSGKVNQLGGVFVNGKPLPNSVRQQIIEMAERGIRPCDISRQLKVSHGCISKLLSKYNDTGSFEPGRAKRKTSRDVSCEVKNKIEEYRRTAPGIFSWEVKEKLVADGLCTKENLPPLTVISRMLRRARSTGSDCDMEADCSKENTPKTFTPFSIENILRVENKNHQPATPIKCIDLGKQLTHAILK